MPCKLSFLCVSDSCVEVIPQVFDVCLPINGILYYVYMMKASHVLGTCGCACMCVCEGRAHVIKLSITICNLFYDYLCLS